MSITETPVLFEDSSKGRVEDPACPDAGRERSERSTQHADLEDFQARLARLNALKQTQSQPQPEQAPRPRSSKPSLGRHTRKCAVCNHPDREQIEDDFLRWHDPWDIADAYDLPSRSSLYRHAEAHGLIALRRRNLRGVAERLLERVDETTLTGNSILQAMRLFAHITEDGQWLEPPKRAIVTHIHTYSPDCHPEPSAPPVRDGGEGPAVTDPPVAPTHPPSNARSDEPVGAASCRPPSASNPDGSKESLPIARFIRAKSSPHDSCHAPSATRHSSFDTHRRIARARDRVKRDALLRDALELLPAATRILAAAEARASADDITDSLPHNVVVAPFVGSVGDPGSSSLAKTEEVHESESLPIARLTRAKSSAVSSHSPVLSGVEGPLVTSHCISNRDTKLQSRSRK